tara:strand:+ start:150 stop:926 length:777 start_codon:yes stop_codon:yes gene_type:complete
MKLPIIVNTSNQYLPLLKIYSYLFNKFWSPQQEVIIVGFDPPTFKLPDNFKFVSLGKQRGIQYWHDDLISTMDLIKEDYFIQMPENELIIRPVNHIILNHFKQYISPSMGRIDLTPGPSTRAFNVLESTNDYDIIESTQDSDCRVSMRACIWNKEYFSRNLKSGESPQYFETYGSSIAKNDGMQIISSNRDFACRILDGTDSGRRGIYDPGLELDLRALKGYNTHYGYSLEEEVIEEMKSLGLIKEKSFNVFGYLEII